MGCGLKRVWAHTPCSKPIRSVDGIAVEPVEGLDGLCVPVGEGSRQADADQAGKQTQKERVQEERSRIQQELAGTKQAAREQLARAEKERDQGHESDLQTRFHVNLDQLRDEIKYRESVERVQEERSRLQQELAGTK